MNTHHPLHTQTASKGNRITPHYFFLTLGMLIALVTTSIAFINLVFGTLDLAFPDVLNATYQYGYNTTIYEGIRTTLATVIIFFPVYIALAHMWAKKSRQQLTGYNAILRKWALYLVLFLVALVVAIDLVVLLRFFVAGELTTRFLLKVASVLIITLTLFWYAFRELKADIQKPFKINPLFPAIATLIVLVGVVYSFSVIGTPSYQRALRLDQKRLEDLQNIQSQVITYWQQKEKLPETLNEMIDPLNNWQVIPKDPKFEKGQNYEYRKIAELEFELCAVFEKPIPEGWQESGGSYPMPMYDMAVKSEISARPGYPGAQNQNWDHQEGRTCFNRKIDKELYPPFDNNPKGL